MAQELRKWHNARSERRRHRHHEPDVRKKRRRRRRRHRRQKDGQMLWIREWACISEIKYLKRLSSFFFTVAMCSRNLPNIRWKWNSLRREIRRKCAKHVESPSTIILHNTHSVGIQCVILVNGRDNSYGCTLCTRWQWLQLWLMRMCGKTFEIKIGRDVDDDGGMGGERGRT